VPTPLDLLRDWLGGVAAKWGMLTAIWGFILYGVGYLALRFQLTAFGIGTDLSVLDERYLFEGAKFLLTMVLAIPLAVLAGLVVAAIVGTAGRVSPHARQAIVQWFDPPRRRLLFGTVFAVLLIQTVMSKCLLFNNLLIAPAMPSVFGFAWFGRLLLTENDTLVNLYFTGLVAGVAVTAACALTTLKWSSLPAFDRLTRGVLVTLLGIELLLLPVNYGYLTVRRSLPRVAAASTQRWLVWEGKEGVTHLERNVAGERRLVTVPRETIKQTDILGYDPVLAIIYQGSTKP